MGVRPAEHVAWREIDGETFVIDLRAKRMYGLNRPGGEVWRALSEGGEPARPRSGAMTAFFDELRQLGLVTGGTTFVHDHEPAAPDASGVPPRVVWQEELRSFGFSCALMEGQSPTCDQLKVG